MTPPIRIQLSRAKGWRLPPNTIVVARPTKWGNPFKASQHGQEQATLLFQCWIDQPEQGPLATALRRDLRGQNLACWCKPGTPCHADVLLKLANEPPQIEDKDK